MKYSKCLYAGLKLAVDFYYQIHKINNIARKNTK